MTQAAEPRWGAQVVDPRGHSLPSLKVKYLLDHVPDAGRVIEMGSGEGKLLRTLAVHKPALDLHGCDVRAPASPPDVYVFEPLVDGRIAGGDHAFDTVIVFDVLEHVPEPARLLDEAARVLAPGGRLVAFVPVEGEPLSFYSLYRRLLGRDTYVQTKEHVQQFTHRALRTLVDARFDVVDWRYAYHLLGHFMDASFFAAARLQRLRAFWWKDNVFYNPDKKDASGTTGTLNKLLVAGNVVAWAESSLFAPVRVGSAGVLLTAMAR